MAVTAVHCLLLHHVHSATAWVSHVLLQGTFTSVFLPICFVLKKKLGATFVLWIKLTHINFQLPKISTMTQPLAHQRLEKQSLMWNPTRLKSELLKWIFLVWFRRQVSILNISQALIYFIFEHKICTSFPKHISVLNVACTFMTLNKKKSQIQEEISVFQAIWKLSVGQIDPSTIGINDIVLYGFALVRWGLFRVVRTHPHSEISL